VHAFVHRPAHGAATRGHTLGSPGLYDAFAEFFFVGRRRATFESLIAAAGVQPGHNVLDVGSGTGYFARLIAAAVGPGGHVVGVDPSAEMVEYARRKARALGNCEFHVGTAEALEFPAERFDVVVTSLVMHHLPEDLRVLALQEMRRVVRTGGRLLIAEAQTPRHGLGWRLLARLHGYDRMARQVPDLQTLVAGASVSPLRTSEAPPWLRCVVATKM
jgi:ubiquinone/menaquinone biosynthesis C-methylase UbiE